MSVTTKSLQFLRRPSLPSLVYRAHYFSTNAALLDEETEEYTTASTTRPRLESLRQQLRSEQESSNTGTTIPPLIPVTKTESAATSTASADDSSASPDLNQLMRQLEALPMPEEPLQDTFGRQHSYLRISLSEKCNLRCLYCMPEDGVPLQPQSHLLSNDEIMRLASWFVQNGVTKIRLTGGEPLLRKDLLELIQNLNTLGLEQIGMTTNGVTLSKQLPELVEAGLSHVNISLDSLDADKFARLTRRPPSYHKRVLQAIEDSAKLLPHRTKINCVVMPDNVDELEAFSQLTRHSPIDVRFIEYMPFNDNQWGADTFISYQDMQNKIKGLQRIEDGPNDTTKWWTLDDQQNSLGRIGFITSMSEHFCGTCNRLRIMADGQLKVCLFGKTEVSLRDLMRQGGSDEALQKLIHYSVQRKHFKLGGHKDMEDLLAHSDENRPMTLIGG
jgi:molybdenum cofactor biosynthesis protein A